MYKVALCEDEEVFAEAQEKVCRDILCKLNIEYQLTTYRSGEEFLCAFEATQARYDLVVLDIVMGGINGIQLAHKIRQADKEVTIIFLTTSRDFALEGYEVNALHYLIKPIDEAVFKGLVYEAYKNRFLDNFIVIKMGSQHLRIALNDIFCLETVGRRVEITLKDKTIYYSGKLASLLLELPQDRFVKCHQAFAVNVRNIRELGRTDAVSVNGKKIPISRTFMKDIKKVFMNHIRRSSE